MKKMIFDVDGVLLSEERYFDVSGLTVWEMLFGPNCLGLPTEGEDFDAARVTDGQIAAIRARAFGRESLFSWLTAHGINSNWDMVHAALVTTFALMAETYRARTGGEILSLSLEAETDLKRAGAELMGLPLPKAPEILGFWETHLEGALGAKVLAALSEAAFGWRRRSGSTGSALGSRRADFRRRAGVEPTGLGVLADAHGALSGVVLGRR